MEILRYNWLELREAAIQLSNEHDTKVCEQIVVLLGLMSGTLTNKYSKKQYHASLRLLASKDKPNFLLNVSAMLLYAKASIEDKCLLAFLASKRNFADYKLRNISYVPLALVEEDLEFYDWGNNPFLSIEDGNINFKLKK